jgi:uncharacterized membrane protein YoaK (UPF0700 family)
MGASSVLPARRTDGAPSSHGNLELISYVNSVAPETPLLTNPHSLIRERREDRVAVAALSATAGYVDAVGFLMLVGLFPAHMTGELVGLTSVFTAGHHMSHPGRLAVIPVFIGALFVAAIVTRSRRNVGRPAHRTLLGLMAFALGACALTGFWQPTQVPLKEPWVLGVREYSMVAAMAFQNAFMREALTNACPTTVMTGNLTQFVFELVDTVAGRLGWDRTETTRARSSTRSRFWLVTGALGSFLAGAVLGGYLTGIVGAFGLVVPMLAALFLARRGVDVRMASR